MIEIDQKLSSIDELLKEIERLRNSILENKKHEHQILSKILFRGQENHSWDLESTLERYSSKPCTVSYYNTILNSIYPAIASFTGEEWPVTRDFNNKVKFVETPPNYEFMAYVRHHGFPSPLLDWSRSLYVALFFAFHKAQEDVDVAIFAYIASLNGGGSYWVGAPRIIELGPYVKTHKRHFLQQGQYTISVKKNDNKMHEYCSYQESREQSSSGSQDLIFKFVLPGSLKTNVLSMLSEMNINAYTLFPSEESLLESLAYQELFLRQN